MSKEKTFSLRKGFTFSFEDEGSTIDAWFSAFTGLEKVYVNGELISSQRNLSTDSTNSFNIGVNQYSTNLNAESILKGPFVCTLSKNGDAYKRQRLLFPKAKPSSKGMSFLVSFLLFLVLGVLFGLARSYWQLPSESIYIFIAVLSLMAFPFYSRKYKGTGPVIENEEIV
jgi:hypothetical protein